MILNGKEIEFKIGNRNHAAAMENAMVKLQKREKELVNMKEENWRTAIDKLIEMFQEFFIEATGIDVLEGCEDAEIAENVFLEFLDELNRQKNKILSQYSPSRIK